MEYNVIVLSAKSEAELELEIKSFSGWLSNNLTLDLTSIAANKNKSIVSYQYRAAVTGRSSEEIWSNLEAGKYLKSNNPQGKIPKIGFLFSGFGSAYDKMTHSI